MLAAWPLPRKAGWVEQVNVPQTEAELQAVRRSVLRGSPLGEASWSERMVDRLGLESTLRPQGRPRKPKKRFLTRMALSAELVSAREQMTMYGAVHGILLISWPSQVILWR